VPRGGRHRGEERGWPREEDSKGGPQPQHPHSMSAAMKEACNILGFSWNVICAKIWLFINFFMHVLIDWIS
jgi:hypothetical protein